MKDISAVNFENSFVSNFKGDQSGNKKPRQTPGFLYSKALPTPVKKPTLVAWSDELAAELDLAKPVDDSDINILGGNLITPSMQPYAACYAGHQFGNWAGQLGDGKGNNIGGTAGKKRRHQGVAVKRSGTNALLAQGGRQGGFEVFGQGIPDERSHVLFKGAHNQGAEPRNYR
jgi:uncharacterized protein YdiU (UPF0061 family)